MGSFKRPLAYIDLTGEDENLDLAPKRFKPEPVPLTAKEKFRLSQLPMALTAEERFELSRLEEHKPPPAPAEEKKVELSEEQQRVVNMAVRKNSIFLTGAAGSGKTTVLKEIMARLRMKRKGGQIHIIAPTGIAALPLGGRTTYSFAGVSC